MFSMLMLGGCSDAPAETAGDAAPPPTMMCDESGNSQMTLIRTLAFIVEESDGVADGFNLDGLVSDGSEAATCMVTDQTSPAGTPGIDNSFASLWANLRMLLPEVQSVDSYIQRAIEEGQILLLLEITGIDDPMNDDCVNITLRRGMGTPMLGTDGLISPRQTFDVDPEGPVSVAYGASIVDGVLEGGPVALQIPVRLLNLDFTLNVENARFRFSLDGDGNTDGIFSGATRWQDILDQIADRDDVSTSTKNLVRGQLLRNADLSPDEGGVCQEISAGFRFDGVAAFTFD
jgi:hypothetical protein